MNKYRFLSRNVRIGIRLGAAFAIIIFYVIILNATAILNINKLSANTVELYEKPYATTDKIWESREALVSLEKNLLQGFKSRDNQLMEEGFKTVNQKTEIITNCIEYLKTIQGDNPEMTSYIQSYEAEFSKLKECYSQIMSKAKSGDFTGANDLFEAQYTPLVNNAIKAAELTYQTGKDNAKLFVENSKKSRVRTIILMDSLFAVIFFSAIILAIVSTLGIIKPMKAIVKSVNEISKGNLNVVIRDNSNDEISALSHSTSNLIEEIKLIIEDITIILGEMAKGNLNVKPNATYLGDFIPIKESIIQIVDSFNNTILKIDKAAEQVASSAENVSNMSQIISDGTVEQTSSVDELSYIINDFSESIKKTVQNSKDSVNLTMEAESKLNIGNEQMAQMLDSMDSISETSHKINSIMNTITAIAKKTDILALNAAIEAQRAGEAGKGFSVVADEVRELANQSSEAAKQTFILVEDTFKAVENGSNKANEMANTIDGVMAASKKVLAVVDEISSHSAQQAESIELVLDGMNQISNVVNTNAATVEESAASSEDLNNQAKSLKRLVQKFELKSN